MSGVARPSQRGLPKEWVLGVDIRLLGEEAVDFIKIAKSRGAHKLSDALGPSFSPPPSEMMMAAQVSGMMVNMPTTRGNKMRSHGEPEAHPGHAASKAWR